MTLMAVSLQPVPLYQAIGIGIGGAGGKFRVTNTDEVNTIYLDSVQTIGATSTPLPPQATVTYDGNRDVWASSLSGSVTVLADVDQDSLTWDNPVGVQIALNALGLATAQLQNSQMAIGIPPYIPGLDSASEARMSATDSPYTLVTMPAAGRLWFATLSYGVATESGYDLGGNDPAARIYINSDTRTILLAQAVIAQAGQNAQADQGLGFGGLPLAEGDVIGADVNGGSEITNVSQNASTVVLYSIP